VKHVTKFLLELGAGVAFVGQVLLDVGGEMFWMATAKRSEVHDMAYTLQ
jgi:predicted nuclease of restriction endonuclease-like (RecB) superfamily